MTDTFPHSHAALAVLPPPLPAPEINPDLLDVESLKVVARLRRHGHTAYLVGGCVRDLLAGARPKDYDVATSAHPEEIRDVFRNSRLIGRRFRLAHVYFPGGKLIEVATFRATPVLATDEDGEPTGDLLLTDDNLFGTAEEDAKRRDFTINGLFYDAHAGRVIDFVGGREDLEKKHVRTIGDPEIRMREDPVRGLRAARIAAKLGFEIEKDTFRAMVRHAGELPRCAPARVLEETLKLLRSGASKNAFKMLRDAGILRVLLPPVEEMLKQGGTVAEERLYARLGALDAMLREGTAISDAVMLSTLLSFLPTHANVATAPEGPGFDETPVETAHVLPSADKVLSQMSAHARLPRRVADRVRAVIGSQKLFLTAHKHKRRRGGTGGFVRAPHFLDAFQLFEIEVRATGQQLELFEKWKVKALEAVPNAGDAFEGEGEESEQAEAVEAPEAVVTKTAAPAEESGPATADAAAKKKRRRGGRRHRRGAGEGSDGTPPPPSGEPNA
jgi:poly(A) polymerase